MAAPASSSGHSSRRVTADNPVQSQDRFDFERCAALHNELLEVGWTACGRSLDDLTTTTWFEYFGEAAETSRTLLSEDLVSFLEKAHMITSPGSGAFFFYVYGLVSPDRLWQNFEGANSDEESLRYLTLYGAHSMASHPDGLVFDMKISKAIMQMSIHDAAVTLNGRSPWYPLEMVLSAWLDMIDVGKIKAMPEDVEVLGESYPWVCLHWNDRQVDDTVTAFDRLVETIETRMRDQGISLPYDADHLLADSTLDAARIPPGFARSFLTKARRPFFTYIAPGLLIPDHNSFLQQPFTSEYEDAEVGEDEDDDDEDREIIIKPILIFRSSETLNQPNEEIWTTLSIHPFPEIEHFPAGVYLTESESMAEHDFQDSIKLVLPFGVGGNGFARTSDGLQIGDHQISRTPNHGDRYTDLYQQGWQPFVEMHEVRLVKVLESWRSMVERGDWKVGSNGVEGDMEAFKQADTEEGWEKFKIPVTW